MRRLKIFFYVFGWFSLILLFQNMSYVTYSRTELPTINEDVRIEQAQELLGNKYDGSTAQKLEGAENLHYHIYGIVYRSLPSKWKSKASEITSTIIFESQEQGLDPVFVLAVIQTESRFNPDAKGRFGDSGLMQILPETGKWIAERSEIPWEGKKALFDPVYNIKLGVAYFVHLRSEFDLPNDYVRAYNMGPKNVRKIMSRKTLLKDRLKGKNKKMYAHVLQKTYTRKVMQAYSQLYKDLAKLER